MPEQVRLIELLNIKPQPPPRELLVAIFAAASEAGLTVDEALKATTSAAYLMDPDIGQALNVALAKGSASVDRTETFRNLALNFASRPIALLFEVISFSETSGENIAQRARALFDELIVQRELRINRRAETYPIAMIIIMVLLFMPAVLLLLVGPSYLLLLRVLRGA